MFCVLYPMVTYLLTLPRMKCTILDDISESTCCTNEGTSHNVQATLRGENSRVNFAPTYEYLKYAANRIL
jgi:hypothetical protein